MASRWQRYWFRTTGQTSAAVLRIAIATSILWMLWRLRAGYSGSFLDSAPHDRYHAIGIWKLWPGEPGAEVFTIVWGVAWAATLLMMLGFATRASTAASFVAAVAIASYEYSFAPSWSHDNNAPLLAQLAFLGARGGDALSIDSWIARRRGAEVPADYPYAWSVMLVQLALGIMMASAALTKLISGGTSLAWVLSDNLRNQMLLRFDFGDLPRTTLADWIMADPVRWKVTAALNIVAQACPLIACLVPRRPVLRLVLGSLFATETLALDLVMGFSNFHWLPLVAAFVDWDRLVARLARMPAEPVRVVVPGRAVRTFIATFLAIDCTLALWSWPRIDQRAGLYPFSGFPMFARIRATPPYDEHLPYELPPIGRIEAVTVPPLPPDAMPFLEQHVSHNIYNVRDPDKLRAELTTLAQMVRNAYESRGHVLQVVRAYVVAPRTSAYPAPARLDVADIAIAGELLADGTYRSALGAVNPVSDGWTVTSNLPTARIATYFRGAYADVQTPIRELRHEELVLARIDDRWFLVGWRD